MAAFRDDEEESLRLDYRLMLVSPVAMYFDARVLEDDVHWLRSHGYAVNALDSSAWRDECQALAALAHELEFPEPPSTNLDSFNDWLGDIQITQDGGRVIVLHRFDVAVARLGSFSSRLLDVFGAQCRFHMLFGRRLVVLLQSDDPRLSLPPIGACPVPWNPREQGNESRGV